MRWLMVLGFVLAVCGGQAGAQVVDRVLAVVDGRLVTLSDVRASTMLGLTPGGDGLEAGQAAERWIERILILAEVDRFAPPEPDQAQVDRRVAELLARLGQAGGAAAELAALGVDASWVRLWVRDDLRIQSYVEQRFAGAVEPTADEISRYLRDNAGDVAGQGTPGADEAGALARARMIDARRRALVADWIDGLRKRAVIVRPESRGPARP